jgi:hypothetical protein
LEWIAIRIPIVHYTLWFWKIPSLVVVLEFVSSHNTIRTVSFLFFSFFKRERERERPLEEGVVLDREWCWDQDRSGALVVVQK